MFEKPLEVGSTMTRVLEELIPESHHGRYENARKYNSEFENADCHFASLPICRSFPSRLHTSTRGSINLLMFVIRKCNIRRHREGVGARVISEEPVYELVGPRSDIQHIQNALLYFPTFSQRLW